MPSRSTAKVIIIAAAIIMFMLALSWPTMSWQNILLGIIIVVFGLAGDNSNRQRLLRYEQVKIKGGK